VVAGGVAEYVVQDERDALGGVIDSSTTRNAMETDSSRVMRSAGFGGVGRRITGRTQTKGDWR
jgi:hypothetical protein